MGLDLERVEYFTGRVKDGQRRAERQLIRGRTDEEREARLLRMALRDLRTSATLAARFAGVSDADPSEAQIDAVLKAVAERLRTWYDPDAAAYLTDDPDARLDLLRKFGHEEPAGL